MGYGYTGASTINDDLNAKGPSLEERKGYIGGGDLGINDHYSGKGTSDWSPDGKGYDIVNGYQQAGTSAFDKDVNRARQMGAAGQQRQAVTLDQVQADRARGVQMGALGLLQNAAHGNAPSRAVFQGQLANGDAIRNGNAAAGAGRGPGQSLASNRSAQAGMGQQMTNANGQLMDQRAAEMAANQGQFAGASAAARGQDISAATTNAQLEAQQRALNEQRQQNFERQGWGVRKSQSQAADDFVRQQQAQDNERRKQRMAEEAQDDATTRSGINMALMAASSVSDERAKRNIIPMGALARLQKGRK
jgi:hypothetical protein